ncbi:MAG TPA: ANTAR domain-containing protein [Propionibacteriaceae bacterium]|nr:ANTAR domain-containing protein [Propionibacteriaceae bacterium]
MQDPQSDGDADWQRRFDELTAKVTANQGLIADLQAFAAAASRRADASDARHDANEARAEASDARADEDRDRLTELEGRVDVDAMLIAELQAEGVLSRDYVANLEEALRSSRRIGAATGVVMAACKVTEQVAFAMLVSASQRTNRKLRLIAEEVLATGDLSGLTAA